MQLTIITETDKTFFMEIGSEMELGDLLALIGAEVRRRLREPVENTR